MRIGIYFDVEPQDGGAYQYAVRTLSNIKRNLNKNGIKLTVILAFGKHPVGEEKCEFDTVVLKLSKLQLIKLKIRNAIGSRLSSPMLRRLIPNNVLELKIQAWKIDLIYFLSPSYLPVYLEKTNYIYTVYDLCHVEDLEFPEIRNNWQFEYREKKLSKTLTRALAVCVDSPHTKRNLISKYHVREARVFVIPLKPMLESKVVDDNAVIEKALLGINSNLKQGNYIIYPAQFWPHKNHIYILKAFINIKDKLKEPLYVVFVGGDKNQHMKVIKSEVCKLSLNDRIIFTGYIGEDHLIKLYQKSLALVMPTFFGPTNLPPLEAFKLGVPVCYPDRDDHKEFLGKGALYFSYLNPSTLGEILMRLQIDDGLREETRRNGYIRLMELEGWDESDGLLRIIELFQVKKEAWCSK
jgi:glycosyltransferase involved in cell wall biosynthesis